MLVKRENAKTEAQYVLKLEARWSSHRNVSLLACEFAAEGNTFLTM